MLLNIFSAVLALSSTGFALLARNAPLKSSVREDLAGPPAGWVKDESIKVNRETSTISLSIHLVHQDMDKFHDLALNVWKRLLSSTIFGSNKGRSPHLDMSCTEAISPKKLLIP